MIVLGGVNFPVEYRINELVSFFTVLCLHGTLHDTEDGLFNIVNVKIDIWV